MQLQWSQFKNQVSDRGEDKDGLALTRTTETSIGTKKFGEIWSRVWSIVSVIFMLFRVCCETSVRARGGSGESGESGFTGLCIRIYGAWTNDRRAGSPLPFSACEKGCPLGNGNSTNHVESSLLGHHAP